MSPWRAEAHAVIAGALEEGRAAGLEGEALVRHVDAHYPFGTRANHPYRVWLNERALLVLGVRRPMSRSKAGSPAVLDGQGDLFGGSS